MEAKTTKVKKILFIVNPISGSGKNNPLEKYIEERFGNPDFSYKILYTEKAGHATELSKTAVGEGTDIE